MPSFNIVKESKIHKTFRTEFVKGQFDLQINETLKEQFHGNIAIENNEWQIGVIIGASGTGKTTIAKQLFDDYYFNDFTYDEKAVIDNMPSDLTAEEITRMFNSVGFATVWSWLKPYHVLSNGERMRVDLAKALLSKKNVIVFDEFTSVVDRTVAKTASYAISRSIRKKQSKKFIAVSCHRDILEWLEPDWIYDTDEQRFFFAMMNSDDQNFNWKFENARHKYGNYFASIII